MKRYQGRLFCFSPPVMIATCIIESCLFVYTIWRYKLNRLTRIVTAMLLFLALFQLAEYNVCGGYGVSAANWSRVGFMAITILPPLAIHLIEVISKQSWRLLKWLAYAMAAMWVYVFGFSEMAFSGHVCAGNYVIFQLNNHFGGWYFAYYYFWLFIGIALCLYFAYKSHSRRIKESLILQLFGYLVFILPTAMANTVSPATISGLPSVMCGFAVLYALILVFGIVPIDNDSTIKKLLPHVASKKAVSHK